MSNAPKGSLYHYFPEGKEAIGEAAVALAGEMVAETLEELAEKHESPSAFLVAYCKRYADWMEESDFQSGCPIATTLLETAPRSKPITSAGLTAVDSWIEIITAVFKRSGLDTRAARQRAELAISALEGALILSRIRRSKAPIVNVGRALAKLG